MPHDKQEIPLVYLRTLSVFAVAIGLSFPIYASETVERTPLAGKSFPIAAAVSVPHDHDLIFLSGATASVSDTSAPAGSIAAFGNTEVQTVSVLNALAATLARVNLKMSDVVQLRVFLVGDPALGGKMDFAGMMAGYTQFFGTKDQPNLPARTTVQVAGLASPGLLVEIEAVAARAH
jgi:enamine deaminase RidA (YjgF/YER057c/UK114 family)